MHLSQAQGAGEKRTEVYLTYTEGVPQPAAPRLAKSGWRIPAVPETGRAVHVFYKRFAIINPKTRSIR